MCLRARAYVSVRAFWQFSRILNALLYSHEAHMTTCNRLLPVPTTEVTETQEVAAWSEQLVGDDLSQQT